jgi:GT2 family glycosyltransferase/glycosyltransferase involved in cell wall biosynthesis
MHEARRVAAHAVVTLEAQDPGAEAPDSKTGGEEPTYSVEHTNGALTRITASSSIIIPTYNGWEQLGRCLVALEETLPHPFEGEVIVVDDGSGEETQAVLEEWEQSSSRLNLKIVRNGSNAGFLESCNRGATAASGDFLIFLNDDTLPQFGWLTALLRTFRTHPSAGAVGGRLLYPDGKLQEAGGVIYSDGSGANFGNGDYLVDDPLFGFVREVDYCSGALLATPRKVFEEIGGFDDRYCPAYYEDTDYCFTLRDRGYRIYYQPESVVVHFEGGTGGTDLSAGVKKHQVSNQAKFATKWQSALRDQPDPPDAYDLEVWHALSKRGRPGRSRQGGRALVSAPLLPEFDREGGSRRIFHMIEFLRSAGWSVSFLAENPYGDERYVRMLQRRGVAVYRGFGPRADDLFKYGNFDLAVFAFWYLAEGHAQELRRVSPDTKIMVDVIDLHWLRAVRRHFLPPVGATDANGTDTPEFGSEMVRELEAYAQADAVLTTSDEEAQMIHNLLGRQSLAHTVPDHEEAVASEVAFRDRRGILFVANFNHPPNLDAVIWFCEEILPKMDRELLKEHPLSIVGHRPPPAVLEYAEASPFINVVGWVPSVVPYLQKARVTIVPMRYGAGTKRKLLQALMSHTPTVTTSMGIEGLSVEPDRHALLADDAEGFAAATERLLRDPKLWAKLSENGSEAVGKIHSREAVLDRLTEVVGGQLGRPTLRLLDSTD